MYLKMSSAKWWPYRPGLNVSNNIQEYNDDDNTKKSNEIIIITHGATLHANMNQLFPTGTIGREKAIWANQ